ncbi:hypothetical protein BT69DRAFT_1347722 [Atractiella rhizophila]|nr:hypothetical protein BT69DRAFT_1347722 [Atractiella rhizophila]
MKFVLIASLVALAVAVPQAPQDGKRIEKRRIYNDVMDQMKNGGFKVDADISLPGTEGQKFKIDEVQHWQQAWKRDVSEDA